MIIKTVNSTCSHEELQNSEVILQAGGRGQRIQPLSDQQPKPLLPVCGVPMIEMLLRQLVSAGFRKITVITGYGRDAIVGHIESLLKVLPQKIRVRFHHEEKPQGNLGVLGDLDIEMRRVLLVFADLVTDLNFVQLLNTHLERGCSTTLTSHYESYRLRLGELSVAGSYVTDYQEKPPKEFLACSGIAVFEPEVIALARELPRPFGISDLIQASLNRKLSITHWIHGAFWRDVNTKDELQEAEAQLTGLLAKKTAHASSHTEVSQ
ncbi:hypothetical protein MNBD_GAMMA16-2013 [hydrothermal vent metagenome]|uniref:Nucleotidyl transferase domain-containing protein n=1 Tax=hydrothermal vent metagenome TaxID=652676 RepID=A0A3B0ZB27_9ZZZZ